MIFGGTKRKRSLALKDVYSVGEHLWLEMNDDTLSKHKLPLIVKFIYYRLVNSNEKSFLEQRSIFILLRLVIDHEIHIL